MKYKLPSSFLLGGSTSGPQTEGWKDKANKNIFDYWYEKDKESFFNQVGPEVASNMYDTYKEDVELFKQVGIEIYRTTIQWTRLIKNIDTWEIDMKAVKFYRDYFLRVKNNGIRLIVNIFHFDIPIIWHEKGGWENKEFTNAFAKYAQICFEQFGDIVDEWSTMNEPAVVSESFYGHDYWWPGLKSFKKAMQVSFNQLVANAKAISIFKEHFKSKKDKKISIILSISPTLPKDNEPKNIKAAEIRNLFSNWFWLDATVHGVIPEKIFKKLIEMDCLFDYSTDELELLKQNTIDFLGVNYYAPARVQSPKLENKDNKDLSKYFESYTYPGAIMNIYRGWEILPELLEDIAELIKTKYKNISWWVSENGMGVQNEERFLDNDGIIQDDYRIDFIKKHLESISKSINNGSSCFAYAIWTPIDCWSWSNAYKNRYGLISVDLKTQKRTIKKSGIYFKKVSTTKEI